MVLYQLIRFQGIIVRREKRRGKNVKIGRTSRFGCLRDLHRGRIPAVDEYTDISIAKKLSVSYTYIYVYPTRMTVRNSISSYISRLIYGLNDKRLGRETFTDS